MNKIRLNILGLSSSQSQVGAYALILVEEDGKRRLPIIIGAFEAHAIALQLEGMTPPRPLTHDLFVSLASSFYINLVEISIHKLEDGIFYSELVCESHGRTIRIDARTSDAVALALRFQCPIYTNAQILDKAGFYLEQEGAEPKTTAIVPASDAKGNLSGRSVDELNSLLNEAVKNEDYERASLIRDEIKRRKD